MLQQQPGDNEGIVSAFRNSYPSLRRVAADMMQGERPTHTLQPTALAHEAFLKLISSSRREWSSESHFMSTMVRFMRQILTDHARRRRALKNGGMQVRVALTVVDEEDRACAGYVELDDLLSELEQIDSRASQVVELSYFGGLSHDEIAALLGVTSKTVQRDWTFARAWLQDSLFKK